MGSVSKHRLGIDDHFPLIRYQNQQSYQICHFGSNEGHQRPKIQNCPILSIIIAEPMKLTKTGSARPAVLDRKWMKSTEITTLIWHAIFTKVLMSNTFAQNEVINLNLFPKSNPCLNKKIFVIRLKKVSHFTSMNNSFFQFRFQIL
jgi:hypothetical protein